MNYGLAYAIGFHPWEDLAEHPPFADKLMELIACEEDEYGPPYGPALDLGTGSAVWGVQLAQRGWEVTGIDAVEKALRRAHERADEAGVEMRLVHGDVTEMREAGIGSGFRLVLDTGTFHGLNQAERAAMGREVTAVAAPDATMVLDCFAPGRSVRCPAARAAPMWSEHSRSGRSRPSRSPTLTPTHWRGCSGSTNASTRCGGTDLAPTLSMKGTSRPRSHSLQQKTMRRSAGCGPCFSAKQSSWRTGLSVRWLLRWKTSGGAASTGIARLSARAGGTHGARNAARSFFRAPGS